MCAAAQRGRHMMVEHMRPCDAGFTYLWLLLLVALMGLGLTLAVEIDATAVRRDKERQLLLIGHQFRNAIENYHRMPGASGKEEYPPSLEAMLKDNRVPGIRRHLRQVFVDPMTGTADWGLVRIDGRIVGVHSLSQQAPIKVEGFEPADAAFRQRQHYAEWIFTYPSDLLLRAETKLPAQDPPVAGTPFDTDTTAGTSGTPKEKEP